MSDDIETKLSAARTRLILDRPFLGALVLRLPMKATKPERCKTIGTDVRALYYNPEYIENLSLDQTQFVLAHEALHCALSHFSRRNNRVTHRWDIACDLAINPLLIQDGLKPPPGVLINSGYEGMTAEEIYPYIDDDMEDETQDEHFYNDDNSSSGDGSGDGGRGGSSSQPDDQEQGEASPRPLTETERDQLSVQWQQRLAGASQQAKQAGKLSGAMARFVEHLLQPQLPWRMLLARYMTAAARDDYSYQRPSRREGDAVLPTLRSAQVNIVVVIDTSGSVKNQEMTEFVSEIDSIKGQVRARLTFHTCDAKLCEQGPWVFEPWEEFRLPSNITGGGGTCFVPVFDWLNTGHNRPDLLVYFTDARGEFPKAEPTYPVLWLIKGKEKVPWGQRIQLN